VATKAQIEKAILEREGFGVELELFDGKQPSLPPYDVPVMAPQGWNPYKKGLSGIRQERPAPVILSFSKDALCGAISLPGART
jgi:hypothetical protein